MTRIMPLAWMAAFLFGMLVTPYMAFAQAGQAAKADADAQKQCDKLLEAIKTADRDAFIANATDTIKEGTTQQVMDALEKQVGMRLKKGFDSTYLCQLRQAGHQVHLWKLSFKDGGDDLVVRLALKDGKVGGFFLN
jgi:hypothetical protein